jgi:MFS family permease
MAVLRANWWGAQWRSMWPLQHCLHVKQLSLSPWPLLIITRMFGYNQGLMGGLLANQTFLDTFPQIDMLLATNVHQLHHLANVKGITVACFNAGCFVGALWCIFWGDRFGRRKAIFIGTFVMLLGAIIQTSSFSLAQFIAGRTILGAGNGINTATVPIWQSEVSKSHRRGQLILLEGACIALGACIAYWVSRTNQPVSLYPLISDQVDFGFGYTQPSSLSWRFPIALQLAFQLVVLAFILPLPESPRWLILFGRENEALAVLGALDGLPPNHSYVFQEFMEVKDVVLALLRGGETHMFSRNKDRYRHRTTLAYVVQVLQQISG